MSTTEYHLQSLYCYSFLNRQCLVYSRAIQYLVLCHPSNVKYVLHLIKWSLSPIRYFQVTPMSSVPLLPQHILQVGNIVNERLCDWLVCKFPFCSLQCTLPHQRHQNTWVKNPQSISSNYLYSVSFFLFSSAHRWF